jgi:hypothetical protein
MGLEMPEPTDAEHLAKHYRAAGARAISRGFAESLKAIEPEPPPWLLLAVANELWSEHPVLADILTRQLNREADLRSVGSNVGTEAGESKT